ncbi:pentapeptide repeat-containing protein [Streptomyces sp. NEAU-YJ-81]|uniref:pentapeptide repeat-containing protein n=1 Tax=Streptomyces sp. NEAU-YJ-81 TaxID=2820288 RepID=UPI001ABC6EEF|nr:pentapeptide repeat-containing protein [Streptomyces sp. NEAU-YJ-81]MBO3681820.1 pentapeptide repeat-containing protein [Streptomyces sp. NEAU-YJ-81]
MSQPGWDGLSNEAKAQAEGQFRLFLVQGLAALGASIALGYTARNYRLSRRGQVTDRLIKALERLSSDDEHIRLGGVLALEQVVHDAPDQAIHISQILSAFLRKHAPKVRRASLSNEGVLVTHAPNLDPLPSTPAPDVQAALTVLTHRKLHQRRSVGPVDFLELPFKVDLSGLHLHGARFTDAWLPMARFDGSDLAGARFDRALLTGASFPEANLSGAHFEGAKSTLSIDFKGANLSGAVFAHADLRAFFGGATLTGSFLYLSKLRNARELAVEQVLSANSAWGAHLPPDIADDLRVQGRVRRTDLD